MSWFSSDKKKGKAYVCLCRCASHAGSWYTNNESMLTKRLDNWLCEAATFSSYSGDDHGGKGGKASERDRCGGRVRAVIAPHAGFSYSGPTAAYAYSYLAEELSKNDDIERIFVLGPSHHVYLPNCAVSGMETLETPLGSLRVDTKVNEELRKIRTEDGDRAFSVMSKETDEDEHSIEMHLPYLARLLERAGKMDDVKIIPILVGSLSSSSSSSSSSSKVAGTESASSSSSTPSLDPREPNTESFFGSILSPYLDDPSNLFVISSDFCHWGERFRFRFHEPSRVREERGERERVEQGEGGAKKTDGREGSRREVEIWESIEWLDRKGMGLIEDKDLIGFQAYLRKYRNTICGRHPIGVLLAALHFSQEGSNGYSVEFTRYAQSSKVRKKRDSSVSYASAVITSKKRAK